MSEPVLHKTCCCRIWCKMLNGAQGAPGPVSPSAEHVWQSLPVPVPQRGAGLGWHRDWLWLLAQGLSSGLGAPGRAGGALCPSSLLSFLPYIQRFIFYTRCHLRLMGAHRARRPRCCALSAAPRTAAIQGGGTAGCSPQPCPQGVPVTLAGHGHCGGLGVVLFCFALCSWGWMGGLFSIWPERGLPNESQVNNTFFKKKNLFKCQH